MAALEGVFEFDPVGPFELKGFSKPVPAFVLKNADDGAGSSASRETPSSATPA